MFAAEADEPAAYDVEVLGDAYVVLPGVFSPRVRRNSAWFAEKVPPLLAGKSFLEIGAGAGVLAVRAAKLGLEVVATDIDPQAVRNVGLNARRHAVAVDAREGSVFDPIGEDERFDTIFWNHPWICADEEVGPDRRASYDQGYQSLAEFIGQAADHLHPGGSVLLGTGSLARLDLIMKLAREAGYGAKLLMQERHPLQVGGADMADFMIYRLTPLA